jgi:hypothetical protein
MKNHRLRLEDVRNLFIYFSNIFKEQQSMNNDEEQNEIMDGI